MSIHNTYSTYHAKQNDVEAKCVLINLEDQSLGRVATKIATILLGKDNPRYTPGVDIAPMVVVINAGKVKPSRDDRDFYWHTGYPGGIKRESIKDRIEKKADKVVLKAVERMLPKNSHGRKLLTKLRVFEGAEHDHVAQNPQEVQV